MQKCEYEMKRNADVINEMDMRDMNEIHVEDVRKKELQIKIKIFNQT